VCWLTFYFWLRLSYFDQFTLGDPLGRIFIEIKTSCLSFEILIFREG
jgi:hypothetical protein